MIISSIAVASSIAMALTVIASQHLSNKVISAKATTNELTIDNAKASTAVLEDWVHSNDRPDKKFRIELDSEHYIDGLFLFNDCQYQSVGATLGDGFVIDNTGKGNANAYNFNICLAVTGVKTISFVFDYTSNVDAWSTTNSRAKVRATTPTPPYDIETYAKSQTYQGLVNGGSYTSTNQDSFSSTSFHTTGSFVKDSYTFGNGYTFLNLCVEGDVIPGARVEFSINQISLTYTC